MSSSRVTRGEGLSPWPSRLGSWTLVASIPLILFGGTVTTMRAGMAENGWLQPDGYLLWTYPWALRVRSAGVFVEHHHRELGSLVGLLSVATLVATWARDRRSSARWLAVAGLAAVGVQGLVGGLRVLENSPELAFLHGALAQAVFALLVAVAVVLDPGWARSAPPRASAGPRLGAPAGLACALSYAQSVLGAWLRHGHAPQALVLHGVGALLAAAALLWAAGRFRRAAERSPESTGRRLRAHARRMRVLLGLQVALGAGAAGAIYGLSGGMRALTIHPLELVLATAHVLVGALLLGSLASAALWGARLSCAPTAVPIPVPTRVEGSIA